MNSWLVPLVTLCALPAMAACGKSTTSSDDTSHPSVDASEASVVDATSEDAAPEASDDSGPCCETSFTDASMQCSEYSYWSTCGDYVQFYSWGTDFWGSCVYDRKSGALVAGSHNNNGELCSWGGADCGTWVSQCPATRAPTRPI